ncbi:MAG: hypothetical protein QM586_10845 [Xenophilus sp.]
MKSPETSPRWTAFDLAGHWLKVSMVLGPGSFCLAELTDGRVLRLGNATVPLFFFFLVLGTVFTVIALAALVVLALTFRSTTRPRR